MAASNPPPPKRAFHIPTEAEVGELRVGHAGTSSAVSIPTAPSPPPAPQTPSASSFKPPALRPPLSIRNTTNTSSTVSSTSSSTSANSSGAGRRGLVVAERQRGNTRLLQQVRNVAIEFSGSQAADFVLGSGSAGLFLSLRFHLLHPDYLAGRAADVRPFRLRVVVCHADTDEAAAARALTVLSQLCVRLELTLLVAWSSAEAARYLETLRAYDSRSPALIQARAPAGPPAARLPALLQEVRFVNKTDAATLASTFGSFARVVQARPDELALCPGLGARKLARLHDAFHQPFVSAKRVADPDRPHNADTDPPPPEKRSRSGTSLDSPPSSP